MSGTRQVDNNHAAEVAAEQRRREAAERARHEAAERARREAEMAHRRNAPAQNRPHNFAERLGIDSAFSRQHFSDRFGSNLESPLTSLLNRADGANQPQRESRPPTPLPPPPTVGERAAGSAVRVNSQDTRDKQNNQNLIRANIEREARNGSTELFTRASRPGRTREGRVTANQAEQVQRDARGHVTSIERATRDGDRLTYERTTIENGRARRLTYDNGGAVGSPFTYDNGGAFVPPFPLASDGPTVRVETWRQSPTRNLNLPTTDELTRRAQSDPSAEVQVNERSIRQSDDQTTVREQTIDGTGRSDSTQIYRTQTNRDGIHGDLDPKFEDGQPIYVTETRAARQDWGKQRTETTYTEFAQGNARATAIDTRDKDGEELPRQWALEIQDGDTYRRQDFVEGNDDFRSVTTRRADGDVVTEENETQFKNKDDEWVRTSSNQRTAFNPDGTIREHHRESADANGASTVQNYERTTRRTSQGLEVYERTVQSDQRSIQDTRRSIQETTSLQGRNGFTLLDASQTLTGPQGTARASIDRDGQQQLTFNGREVKSLANLGRARDFVQTTLGGLAAQVSAANPRTGAPPAPDEPRAGQDATTAGGVIGAVRNAFDAAKTRTTGIGIGDEAPKIARGNNRLIAHNFFSAKLGAGSSIANLIGAGLNLHQSLQQGNRAQIAADAASVGSGALGTLSAGMGIAEVARGGVPFGMTSAGDDALGRGAQALRFGSKAVPIAGQVLGFGVSLYDAQKAWQTGDTSQRVAAGVSVAGAGIGLGVAVASAAGVGSLGGPVGTAVGAGIGLAAYGISQGINAIADDEHDIPDVVI